MSGGGRESNPPGSFRPHTGFEAGWNWSARVRLRPRGSAPTREVVHAGPPSSMRVHERRSSKRHHEMSTLGQEAGQPGPQALALWAGPNASTDVDNHEVVGEVA